jgi:hypothetical protein
MVEARRRGTRGPAAVDLVADHDLDPLAQGAGRIGAGEAALQQHPGVAHRGQQLLFGRQHELRE